MLWSARGGKAFIFNAFLTDGFNPQIQEWAYFNYLIYHLAVRAAGQTPLSFADYPASPVPHAPERNILLGVMGLDPGDNFRGLLYRAALQPEAS